MKRTKQKTITQIADRDGWECRYCHHPLGRRDEPGIRRATIDHVTARKNGGTDALSNLALACRRCNRAKGHQNYWDFRAKALDYRETLAILSDKEAMASLRRAAAEPDAEARGYDEIRAELGLP